LRPQLLQRFADADPGKIKDLNSALDALKDELGTKPRQFSVGDLPGFPVSITRVLAVVEARRLLVAERELLGETVQSLPAVDYVDQMESIDAALATLNSMARRHESERLRAGLADAIAALQTLNEFLDTAPLQLSPATDEQEAWRKTTQTAPTELDAAAWAGLQSVTEIAAAAVSLRTQLTRAEAEVALRIANATADPKQGQARRDGLSAAADELERAYARADRRFTLIADSSDRNTRHTVEQDLPKLRTLLRQIDQSMAALNWLVRAERKQWEEATPFWKRRLTDAGSAWTSIRTGSSYALNHPLFSIGDAAITLGGTLRVIAILLAAWFISRWLRHGLERYGERRPDVSRPALYAAGRIVHYLMIALGFGVALTAIGLDLTKVAIFASALGVGIGFGLQTVVNNFISGLILLFERSLKIGDFVELESGVTGEVTDISIRATRVTTNDNIDILVPNSEFVNGRVTSWTLREITRRIRLPFGVAYGIDKELVKKAALEAAAGVPFTVATSGPRRAQVWLVGFGDSSLDFELVVWLTADAVKRPGAVQAAYYWALEDALRAHGIEIPFPQRDLHVRSLFGTEKEDAKSLWQGRPRKPRTEQPDSGLSKAERRQLGGNDALNDALSDMPKATARSRDD
jgi:small-conductance mechanosensitive channel